MPRKPIHLEATGGKGPRQRIWEYLRRYSAGATFERISREANVDDRTLDGYLKCMVKGITWPEGSSLAAVGVETEHGSNYAFCVVNVDNVTQQTCDEMVIKAASLFGGALAENGQMSRLCVTIKHDEERARVFIPLDLARQIGTELIDSVSISIASKRDLVMRCDWNDIDRLVQSVATKQKAAAKAAEPEAMNVVYTPPQAEPAKAQPADADPRPVLVRYFLTDGSHLLAAESMEAGDYYVLTDDGGRFHRLKKTAVQRVVRP